tara:strand:- start:24 stop:764 length:741 start_codon:yes stop_codon:yes gene_type:complete
MKQTFFLIAILLLLFGSCSSLNDSKKIESFEKTLGADNSKVLSEYVQAFENQVLKKKYPTLPTDKAYSKLLSENPNSIASMKLYELFTAYDLDKYFESQLWHEIYAPVDSVFIENSLLTARFVYFSEEGKKKVGQSGGISVNEMNRDSIVERELSVCYFNNQGKYWQAIESIRDGIPFLEEFYTTKNRMSYISIGHFSEMVKRHKLDLNNFLARRIVAVELSKFINDAREPEKNTFANKGNRCTTP